MNRIVCLICIILSSCQPGKKMHWPVSQSRMTGHEFYTKASSMNWKDRNSLVLQEILSGNIPPFLRKFSAVQVSVVDSLRNELIKATYYVAPDYLSIGSATDWARINITPIAAQKIADSFHCFLPTRKMVNDIYTASSVKLEPVPMFAFRDSTPTMWQHHLVIEGQRKGKRGLIAGIKKDVVISGQLTREMKTGRVAIYGWHKPDGQPVQPLYTGHIYWWVDYSQGIRLVYRKIKVNGKWMDYVDVLKDQTLRPLLCDEAFCDFYRYEY